MENNSERLKLNKAVLNRWSPKTFTGEEVTDEMLALLFDAARRAPSSRNEQPWQYHYARKQDENAFNRLFDLLTDSNKTWAKNAQVLILSVAKLHHDFQQRPNIKALHDTGAANISLAIQAAEMGFQAHQMGGFDKEKALELLQLDADNYTTATIIAIGFPTKEQDFSEEDKKRWVQHATRKEQKDFVFRMK